MNASGSDHILELDVPQAAGCVDGVCEMPAPAPSSSDSD